jgi:hypothetical protein
MGHQLKALTTRQELSFRSTALAAGLHLLLGHAGRVAATDISIAAQLPADGRRGSGDQASNLAQAEPLGTADLNGGAFFNAEFGIRHRGSTVPERSGVALSFCRRLVIKKIYDEFSFGANNRWDWWFSLFFSLPLCAVIFISVEPDFRILADETNLLSTSYALYSGFQFINITEKLFFFNLDHVISAEPAYRPALYPTLTAMLHYAFGFRWFNGIVLNFFVGLLSLSLLQFVLTKFGGRLLGVTGACLLASMPLFQLNITSSGFDALNSLMIIAVYYQLYRFNERPNANQAELLIALGILAAQARYETLVLFLPITLILLANARNLVRENYTPCLPLMPILAFPIVWQKIITQSFANAGESPDNVLSFYNVPDNALQALLFSLILAAMGMIFRSLSHM